MSGSMTDGTREEDERLGDGLADETGEDDIFAGSHDIASDGADAQTAVPPESIGVSGPAGHPVRPAAVEPAVSGSSSAGSSSALPLPRWSQPQPQQRDNLSSTFQQLPEANRWLLGSGLALVSLALLMSLGPPLAASLQATIHPYTVAGKQETCASRIRSVALALAAYAQDNDGRFPPLDYATQDQRAQPQGTQPQSMQPQSMLIFP